MRSSHGFAVAIVAAVMALPEAAQTQPTPAQRPAIVRLRLVASGAVHMTAEAEAAVDGAHFCSAARDPWRAPNERDARPAPYPFYRVVFGQSAPDRTPDFPGPTMGLALSSYFARAREHSDPANDSIEIVLGGRHFVGHSGVTDPEYRLAATFRDDGEGGGVIASHLQENGTGNGMVDIAATWSCPRVSADMPEMALRTHALFSGATPVRAEPRQLRLFRFQESCKARIRCADWRAIDQSTGEAIAVRVSLRRLKLGRALRAWVDDGSVDLTVDADVSSDDPPRVVPYRLLGVQPHAPWGQEPAPVPPPAIMAATADSHP